MNYIVAQNVPFYLVRMIPPTHKWDEEHVTMAFPPTIVYKL
jgi:hypothetical protein